jgi:signal transduction histidine kinase
VGWVSRLFDARDSVVRLLLLDLSGLGYLLFGREGQMPSGPQWLLAGLAFVAAPLLCRRPLVGLLAQSALLIAAFCFLEDPTINQVGTGWMLLELALWAPRLSQLAWACGLVAAIYVVDAVADGHIDVPNVIFGLGFAVGLPVLLGMVIRTTRELGRQQQGRLESESRAARADERAAIARELHDVVAHHVASIVLRVGVARQVLPDLSPQAREVLDDVHGTGSTALADLRRLVGVLRDPQGVRPDAALTAIEPSALPAALDGAVETARRTGLVVDADISGPVGSLDAVRGLAVLRLTQEALTNVAKHAGTSAHARLRVEVADDAVTWEVSDEGGTAVAVSSGGHGLTGMRERVEVLGGRLEAGPHGKGWRVATVLRSAS